MSRTKSNATPKDSMAKLGFEAKLWPTAFNDSDWFHKDDDVRSQNSEQHICNL